ncbi:class I adenylate-forming enzyme family protein [Thiolapillus sp.]
MFSLNPLFCIEYQGKSYPAEVLEKLLDSLCGQLQDMGCEPDMVVASLASRRWLNALLLFALPRIGCVFFPVDPTLPVRQRRKLLSAAQADVLLSDDSSLELLETAHRDGLHEAGLKRGAVQLLLATSGTQGQPRVVELTGQHLSASVQASQARLGLDHDDTWLACLPLHHVGGLSILLRCARAGAKVVLLDCFDAAAVLDALVRQQVTHLSVVPTMLRRLLGAEEGFRPPASLRVVLLGGAAAPPGLVEDALQKGWPVCPSYGLTETASQVATLCPPPGQWQPGCVGPPLEHIQIDIAQGNGGIRVRGPSVAACARGEGGQRLQLQDDLGWFNTGDLGWLDEEGRLYVHGRGDDMLISGGENIHPHMLERELLHCPGVEEVAVTALEDAAWGDALVALYCGSADTEQVRSWAKRHLTGAFVPKHFLKTDSLPRNAMGKLLRAKLRQWAAAMSEEE